MDKKRESVIGIWLCAHITHQLYTYEKYSFVKKCFYYTVHTDVRDGEQIRNGLLTRECDNRWGLFAGILLSNLLETGIT